MQTELPRQRPILALVIRLGAALALAMMLVFVKLGSESGMHLAEILFWRQLPTVPLVIGYLALRGNLGKLKTQRPKVHGKRALYGLAGMFLNFGAVTLLPLAEATTFGFTSAIWAVILSAVLLKETVGPYRWAAVILGFAGVLVIAQPGHAHIPLFGAGVALGSAFMIALISIQIRDLNRTEEPLTIVFYFALFTLPVLATFLPFVGHWHHTPYQWMLLAGLGCTGLFGQLMLTAALRYGPVSSVIVMDYSGLIWATLFGWLFFSNLPPASTWVGAPLIVMAGLIIAYREHKLAIERADTVPPGGVNV
ncbi:DMT family transporter [Altererythrobacter sp. FM1]|uniref:DMT family transporter n=1 Tax=Tsuneonella flava TaxID=2055955 RepID=A0ABX7KFP7_9SPHN|nr:DMT family transporter [Tsuneonella flava]QSB45880.1 DMT family transporter [Tsuneonella flava]ROT93320.1 DMT family transporter [Altererythrobacter sp. FM1]